jgi:hypothetical protein
MRGQDLNLRPSGYEHDVPVSLGIPEFPFALFSLRMDSSPITVYPSRSQCFVGRVWE